jgi:hypothetical protein
MLTVTSQDFAYWDIGGTAATLYIYAHDDFVSSDGNPVVSGKFPYQNWRHKIDCTIADGVLTVPSIEIESTTNADDPSVRFVAVLIDQTGVRRNFIVKRFRVPHTLGATITWSQIKIYNNAQQEDLPPTYYTAEQVNALLANFASSPELVAALAQNAEFLEALVAAILASDIVSTPEDFGWTSTGSNEITATWEPSNSFLPLDHYILTLRLRDD